MTETDPRIAAHRRLLLERLASNTRSPAIADMARELLTGRITPRQAMASGAFGEEFNRSVATFGQWYGGLSETEKQDAARRGMQLIDEEAEAQEEQQDSGPASPQSLLSPSPAPLPRATRRRPRPADEDDIDMSDRTFSQRRWPDAT